MDKHILFLTAETCPIFHADVNTLFGKYSLWYRAHTDIVAGKAPAHLGKVSREPSC